MPLRRNPAGLHAPDGYHHLVELSPQDAAGLVLLAGQCPVDEQDRLVGEGDLLAQTAQVVRNLRTALAAAGAEPADAVRAVVYVASAEPSELAAVWHALLDSEIGAALGGAGTLVGVTCLGYPGQRVEVDLTVAVPNRA